METLVKIKQALRIQHDQLNADILSEIEACWTDLQVAGVIYAEKTDPLIFSVTKLWCKANFTDDTVKAAEYSRRYETLKGVLMMAEGYGRPRESNDE